MSNYRLVGILIILASAFSHVRYLGSATWNFGTGQIIINLVIVVVGLLCLLSSCPVDSDIIELEDDEEIRKIEDGKEEE